MEVNLRGGDVHAKLLPKEVAVLKLVLEEYFAAENEARDEQLSKGTVDDDTIVEDRLEIVDEMLGAISAADAIVNAGGSEEEESEQ